MKKSILFAALAVAASAAFAQEQVYVRDTSGEVVMSGTGLCVRTGYWTPELAAKDAAGCKCDKEVIPAAVCNPVIAVKAAPTVKPVVENITLAADTLFDYNKATLRAEGIAKLDELVAKTGAFKLEVILVIGHTDRIGSDKYNQALSEKRANAVKAHLLTKGIAADRVYTEGQGEKHPVTKDCAGNKKTEKLIACLQPDRRVELEVIGYK